MGKILCATRGGEASYRTQDAVIERARAENSSILFLYAADVEFLKHTASGVRTDVMQQEMARMGSFLLAMACERAGRQDVAAEPVLRHGPLAQALIDVALEEQPDWIALGRPAGSESVFQLTSLQRFAERIQQQTGIRTEIVP